MSRRLGDYGWKVANGLCVWLGALAALGCSSSSSSDAGGCQVKTFTCGQVLPAATLMAALPDVTGYPETGHLFCKFSLPMSSGGIFNAFCGDEALLAKQLSTAQDTWPGMANETDTIGKASFEVIVGAPMALGSVAEVDAVTSNGKYVFNVSLSSNAARIEDVRVLADAIDLNLSAL